MKFTALDWALLVAYLALTVTVGIWVKRYVEDLSGYIVAGRRIRTALGVATFSATELGTSKALASESPAVAKKVFWITGLTFAGRAMIPMFWGVAALAFFGPDEASAAMPKLLGTIMPVGLLGLLVAGLLAASMSTYSSYVLAWSSVATLDVVSMLRPGGFGERVTIRITRIVAGLIGLFLLVFGLWYEIPETAFQYLFITGAMYTAGALGCVTAGLYWRRANTVGAYAALLLGALAPAGFLILEKSRETLPGWLAFTADVNVSGMLSFVLAALGMVVGSLLTQCSHPARAVQPVQAYPLMPPASGAPPARRNRKFYLFARHS